MLIPQICKPSLYYRLKEQRFFKKEASTIEREKFRMSKFIPSFCWVLYYIRRLSPDVIIIRNRNLAASIVYLAGKLSGVHHILSYTQDACYSDHLFKENSFKHCIKRLIYPSIVYSPVEKSEVNSEKLYKTGHHFIPFAMNFDDKLIVGRQYCKGGYINVLDVGKYRDYKNHSVLVKTIALLPENIRRIFRISILGQAYNEEEKLYKQRLEQFIIENNLSNIIYTLDAVPYTSMKYLYLSNDIFILTSKKEAASISILEAMKYGVVCISTNRNGTASYINTNFGYIFESDNENSLKDILLKLVDNRLKISEMGLKTYEYAKQNFSADAYFMKLKSLIDE